MGFTDILTKAYLRENTVFADAFNYLLYDGEQVNPRMLIERNAAMVISAATHTSIKLSKKETTVDMCKAIEEMIADAKAEGIYKLLGELVRDGLLDIEEASRRADMSVEDFKVLLQKSRNMPN